MIKETGKGDVVQNYQRIIYRLFTSAIAMAINKEQQGEII